MNLEKLKPYEQKDGIRKSSLSPFPPPAGIKSKMQLSHAFLKRKLDEYEMLKMEIEELKRDLEVK